MADNADENLDSLNETTEEVDNTEEVEETVADTETEDKPEYTESEKKLYARTKKAESDAKEAKKELAELKKQPKPETVAKTEPGLTPMDTIALITAKVIEKEDIEFVAEYAQFKKVPVSEALKSGVVKSELAQRIEQRSTAEATNTGTARRGSSKPNLDKVITDASEGKLPDDPELLAEANFARKFNKQLCRGGDTESVGE